MFCKFTRLAYEYIYVTLYCASSLESDPLSVLNYFLYICSNTLMYIFAQALHIYMFNVTNNHKTNIVCNMFTFSNV